METELVYGWSRTLPYAATSDARSGRRSAFAEYHSAMGKRYAHFAPERTRSAATRLGTFLGTPGSAENAEARTTSCLIWLPEEGSNLRPADYSPNSEWRRMRHRAESLGNISAHFVPAKTAFHRGWLANRSNREHSSWWHPSSCHRSSNNPQFRVTGNSQPAYPRGEQMERDAVGEVGPKLRSCSPHSPVMRSPGSRWS